MSYVTIAMLAEHASRTTAGVLYALRAAGVPLNREPGVEGYRIPLATAKRFLAKRWPEVPPLSSDRLAPAPAPLRAMEPARTQDAGAERFEGTAMERLLTLKEIRELFNGTDLQILALRGSGGPRRMNYRLQVRSSTPSGAPDVWGDYGSMIELNFCGVFRWALERAGDLLPEHDERQKLIRRILAQW